MKKQNKATKFEKLATLTNVLRERKIAGLVNEELFKEIPKLIKQKGAKDGSIPTHPLCVVPHHPESQVLKDCLSWLKKKGIVANRNNVGSGVIGSGWYSYGIKGAGDIIGLLKDGTHFEIECKAGKGGRLSAEQQKRKQIIENSNGIFLVVHGLPELIFYFGALL